MTTVAAGSNTQHDPTSDWNVISAAKNAALIGALKRS
jgi:hypothetical protein